MKDEYQAFRLSGPDLKSAILQMPDEEQDRFRRYGHREFETAFKGRRFFIYRARGANADELKPPLVVSQLVITNFSLDIHSVGHATIRDESTDSELQLTAVPTRLFNYHIYGFIPGDGEVRWQRVIENGKVFEDICFPMVLSTKNKRSFYSKGNTYIAKPNDFWASFASAEPASTMVSKALAIGDAFVGATGLLHRVQRSVSHHGPERHPLANKAALQKTYRELDLIKTSWEAFETLVTDWTRTQLKQQIIRLESSADATARPDRARRLEIMKRVLIRKVSGIEKISRNPEVRVSGVESSHRRRTLKVPSRRS